MPDVFNLVMTSQKSRFFYIQMSKFNLNLNFKIMLQANTIQQNKTGLLIRSGFG